MNTHYIKGPMQSFINLNSLKLNGLLEEKLNNKTVENDEKLLSQALSSFKNKFVFLEDIEEDLSVYFGLYLYNQMNFISKNFSELIKKSGIINHNKPNIIDFIYFPFCIIINDICQVCNEDINSYILKSGEFFDNNLQQDLKNNIDSIKKYFAEIESIKNAGRNECFDLNNEIKKLNALSKEQLNWSKSKDDMGPTITISIKFKTNQLFLEFLGFLDQLQTATDHHVNIVCHGFDKASIALSTHHPKPTVSSVDVLFANMLTKFLTKRIF